MRKAHLLVLLFMLIVEVGLEGEFGAAVAALEAARVEERKVFEGPHPIHLIHDFAASQTGGLVEVRSVHCWRLVIRFPKARGQSHCTPILNLWSDYGRSADWKFHFARTLCVIICTNIELELGRRRVVVALLAALCHLRNISRL